MAGVFATAMVIRDSQGKSYAVPYINPTTLVISRGAEPSLFTITIPDTEIGKSDLDDFVNPVKIEITTPDSLNNETTLVLENWYMQTRTPSAPGLFRVTIMDARVRAQQRLLTAEYNVQISDGTDTETYRRSSLNNGSLWKAYDAAKNAIEQFGLEFEDESEYPASLKEVILPDNLGNSIAGGYRGATWEFAMPQILDAIRSDIVVLANGKVTITDRSTVVSDSLGDFVAIDGVVGTRDQHWTHPKSIKIKFDTRIMRWFYINEAATVARSIDLDVVNVIPGSVLTPFGQIQSHEVLEAALRAKGFNLNTIRRNWMAPILIPRDSPTLGAIEIQERAELDARVRYSFRTLFRVSETETSGLTNIRMGWIGYDGDTISDRNIYMPYERVELHTEARSNNLQDILKQFLSSAIPLDLNVSAPWIGSVNYSQAGEMIVNLIPDVNPYLPLEHQPGRLANRNGRLQSIRFGDALDLKNPSVVLPSHTQLGLSNKWELYIFYHGLLTIDRPDLGLTREHTIELPMFPDGPVDFIEEKVVNVTANYRLNVGGFRAGQSPGKTGIPMILLNEHTLEKRAEEIRDQVKKNFENGQAGIFYTGGVDAVVAGGNWVRGNVNSLMIKFGAEKPYTVKCQWVVMPEVATIRTEGPIDGAPTMNLG